jgi:hypothetical protein
MLGGVYGGVVEGASEGDAVEGRQGPGMQKRPRRGINSSGREEGSSSGSSSSKQAAAAVLMITEVNGRWQRMFEKNTAAEPSELHCTGIR